MPIFQVEPESGHWKPKAPTFRLTAAPEPGGADRNAPCPCGSGLKAKKCKACKPKAYDSSPVHSLSDVAYFNEVEAGLAARYGEKNGAGLFCQYLTSHVRPYWDSGAITVAQCVALLVELWEKYDKPQLQVESKLVA